MIASGRLVGAGGLGPSSAVTRTPVAPVQVMTTSAAASSAARSVQRRRAGAVLPGEPGGALGAAVDHRDLGRPRGGRRWRWRARPSSRRRRRRPACRRGRRPRRRDPVEGGADQRRGGEVDVGLGAGALADPQGLLEQHVEGGADGAELLPEAQRLAGLAEDLALADRHRVEAGGDVEEVGDGAVVVVHVEVRQDRLGRRAGPLDEQPRHVLDAAVEAVDVGVDLEPVAGGDDRRLGDVLAAGRVVDQLVDAVAVQGDLLEEVHRRGVVGDAHDEDAHAVSPWVLRCSW